MIDELNDNLKEAYEKSPLPDKVDKNKVNKFIIETYEEHLFNRQENKNSNLLKLESLKEEIENISTKETQDSNDYQF